jgi:hypothetical protein
VQLVRDVVHCGGDLRHLDPLATARVVPQFGHEPAVLMEAERALLR